MVVVWFVLAPYSFRVVSYSFRTVCLLFPVASWLFVWLPCGLANCIHRFLIISFGFPKEFNGFRLVFLWFPKPAFPDPDRVLIAAWLRGGRDLYGPLEVWRRPDRCSGKKAPIQCTFLLKYLTFAVLLCLYIRIFGGERVVVVGPALVHVVPQPIDPSEQ